MNFSFDLPPGSIELTDLSPTPPNLESIHTRNQVTVWLRNPNPQSNTPYAIWKGTAEQHEAGAHLQWADQIFEEPQEPRDTETPRQEPPMVWVSLRKDLVEAVQGLDLEDVGSRRRRHELRRVLLRQVHRALVGHGPRVTVPGFTGLYPVSGVEGVEGQ